ncbi:MAG: formate dehydrogenase accessory sulfurtransferase FdhD [Methanomicrobiaceae archaeon]|uniref:Formate dehydrogenase chain d n=1 Tax=hydrocarbon metagenome TaxID=938273 RepID=A0A0W8FJ75_9ZZZZ|nr:formate dehydrogenase accessory sulfurtransferase FdhD [Methanomicrobiaceae archaeon]MDD5420498.1 formate dehydrogenase accessory sulfurtransferase FdhD [Methanomicrobiaceae archaeon]
MKLFQYTGVQVRDGRVREIRDDIAIEERFSLYLNDRFLTTQVASPECLRELGAGFVVCEGLADEVHGVDVSGNEIRVYAPSAGAIALEVESSGGYRVAREPAPVRSAIRVRPDDIFRITAGIESESWRKTGGVHCSVLYNGDRRVARICDVGRHNTVDKVVGHAVLNGIDRSACILGCTGRQPAGMVAKIAHAGIPIVISRAASSDQGIMTAVRTGVTLICFSRDGRFTVYAHPERVEGISPDTKQGT